MLITFAKFEQTSKMLAIFDYKLFLDLLSLSDFCKSFDATASTCVRLTQNDFCSLICNDIPHFISTSASDAYLISNVSGAVLIGGR